MPPFLFIAGIPTGLYLRVKNKLPKEIDGWTVRYYPSQDHRKAIVRKDNADEILQLAVQNLDGSHVLAFSEQADRQPDLQIMFRRHFRFRWLYSEYLYFLQHDMNAFLARLRREIDFETEWRNRLRPQDYWSPVLLPEKSFSSKIKGNIWQLVAGVAPPREGEPITEIERVKHYTGTFTASHKNGSEWVDRRDLRFAIGTFHGTPPEEKWLWKFSWRVPDGFHYDVSHVKGRGFIISDIDGATKSIRDNDYINIDCHGRCR